MSPIYGISTNAVETPSSAAQAAPASVPKTTPKLESPEGKALLEAVVYTSKPVISLSDAKAIADATTAKGVSAAASGVLGCGGGGSSGPGGIAEETPAPSDEATPTPTPADSDPFSGDTRYMKVSVRETDYSAMAQSTGDDEIPVGGLTITASGLGFAADFEPGDSLTFRSDHVQGDDIQSIGSSETPNSLPVKISWNLTNEQLSQVVYGKVIVVSRDKDIIPLDEMTEEEIALYGSYGGFRSTLHDNLLSRGITRIATTNTGGVFAKDNPDTTEVEQKGVMAAPELIHNRENPDDSLGVKAFEKDLFREMVAVVPALVNYEIQAEDPEEIVNLDKDLDGIISGSEAMAVIPAAVASFDNTDADIDNDLGPANVISDLVGIQVDSDQMAGGVEHFGRFEIIGITLDANGNVIQDEFLTNPYPEEN